MSSGRISALDALTVSRIAAGEVVQRPSSALKELLENALDAGGSQIQVLLKQGGLKLLQVTDDGCGIHGDDLPILCQRFTTSKLKRFEDLQSIGTLGFRGEALSSISHVAHLEVTTKREGEPLARNAVFADGELVKVKPIAGVQGTTIVVQDLFYNSKQRLQALAGPSEEYARCLRIVERYAVQFEGIAFSVRKHGTQKADLVIPKGISRLECIRLVFGNVVARELLEVNWEGPKNIKSPKVQGFISNPNYHSRSSNLTIFFINDRLVECPALKNVIQSLYQEILPKQAHPFVFLSLKLSPEIVDVNVHPTKNEVGFLFETEICELLREAILDVLQQAGQSRTFYTQTKLLITEPSNGLSNASQTSEERTPGKSNRVEKSPATTQNSSLKLAPQKMIRTSHSDPSGRLKAFLEFPDHVSISQKSSIEIEREVEELTSIENLLEHVERKSSNDVADIFREHSFVGCVDDQYALIQYKTRLLILDMLVCSFHFFYEFILRSFGRFEKILINPGLSIHELALMSLDLPESQWTEQDGSKEEIARFLSDLLVSKREMLEEYFSIEISESGELLSLPYLLHGYEPPFLRLPMFLLRLGTDVNWEEEEACLKSISVEIAHLYKVQHQDYYFQDSSVNMQEKPTVHWTIQHLVLPSMRSGFSPPRELVENGSITQIASLENLYKIFERC